MNLSRLLCLAIALNVLLGLSSSLVDAFCRADGSTGDSAPAAPLNEESTDAFEFDIEFDDLAFCGLPAASLSANECRGENLSERRLLLSPHCARSNLAPRAPPAC